MPCPDPECTHPVPAPGTTQCPVCNRPFVSGWNGHCDNCMTGMLSNFNVRDCMHDEEIEAKYQDDVVDGDEPGSEDITASPALHDPLSESSSSCDGVDGAESEDITENIAPYDPLPEHEIGSCTAVDADGLEDITPSPPPYGLLPPNPDTNQDIEMQTLSTGDTTNTAPREARTTWDITVAEIEFNFRWWRGVFCLIGLVVGAGVLIGVGFEVAVLYRSIKFGDV